MKGFTKVRIRTRSGYMMAVLLIIIFAFYIVYLKNQENTLVQSIQNGYNESLYDLVEYVNNVETLLAKSQITSTPEYSAKTLVEVWREANLAESCLSKIPITHTTLETTVKFLNQVSDYSYSLSQKTIDNQELTDEDFNNLENLYKNCKTLNATLSQLLADINTGGISWTELTKSESTALFAQEVSNMSQDSFGNIEKDLQEYAGLIYDGPFSEHMTSIKPQGLGEGTYAEEDAKKVVYEYVAQNSIKNINYNGIIESTIKAHSFTVETDNGIVYMDITETGGKVLQMNYIRDTGEVVIDMETASKNAIAFLEGHGFKNMKESYYTNNGTTLTINYAYTQNGVICYPDLVKVKVALDNGEIVGMESKGYLNCHHQRNFEEPKITIDEAREKINDKIEISSQGLAIIPTDWSTELLTYEFKGKVGENEFIVYINTKTGKEEKVYMIINSQNGMLAI